MPQMQAVSVEEWCRTHFDRVYNFCRALLSNEADAQDASQEVFLTVLRRRDELAQIREPWPWLLKVARLTCLYFRRTRARRGAGEPLEGAEEAPEVGPPIGRDELDRIWSSLDRLPERYRAILALHFQQGLSHAELAAVLEVSRGTVRVLLHRAIARLRQEVRKP
jgi:RNA polymerase sigma-70 factor (ECF subfamily)